MQKQRRQVMVNTLPETDQTYNTLTLLIHLHFKKSIRYSQALCIKKFRTKKIVATKESKKLKEALLERGSWETPLKNNLIMLKGLRDQILLISTKKIHLMNTSCFRL